MGFPHERGSQVVNCLSVSLIHVIKIYLNFTWKSDKALLEILLFMRNSYIFEQLDEKLGNICFGGHFTRRKGVQDSC